MHGSHGEVRNTRGLIRNGQTSEALKAWAQEGIVSCAMPPGKGWEVHSAHGEAKATVWMRRVEEVGQQPHVTLALCCGVRCVASTVK